MKPFLRLLLIPAFLWVLSACTQAELLNALVTGNGYALHRNIGYGEGPQRRLDIYVPEKLTALAPVMVFFHGGSWQSGKKEDYRFVGQALTSKGYIAVIADYRLYPEVYFPAFLEDGAQAIAWTHAHIADYGGDPQALFVAGHSAGAYNAIMLTVNDRFIKAAGGKRSWIRGAIGLAGPYDFLPFTDPNIKAIFSQEKDAATQPITYVTAHLPPILLAAGDADEEVYPKNTKNMAARLQSLSNPVTVRLYPGVGHLGIILAVADGFRSKAPVLDDIDQFVRMILQNTAAKSASK